MHVISRKKLRDFIAQHPNAKSPLDAWYRIARRESWADFHDVRQTCASADPVDEFVVFNIGGNKYRLIAAIHYNRGKIYIRHVLTHADYDKGKWKEG